MGPVSMVLLSSDTTDFTEADWLRKVMELPTAMLSTEGMIAVSRMVTYLVGNNPPCAGVLLFDFSQAAKNVRAVKRVQSIPLEAEKRVIMPPNYKKIRF